MRYCKRMLSGMVLVLLWVSSGFAITLVEAEWLKKELGGKNIRIVDVSGDPETYDKEHIPGAVKVSRNIDLADTASVPPNHYPTKEQFEQLMPWLGIDKDTIVVAYDDKFGLYASRFLVIMELYGHENDKLRLLNGGMVRWKALGNPVTREHAVVKPTKYKVDAVRLDVFVTWSDMYRDAVLGGRPEVTLLDSRPADEYEGKNIRSIRGGRIPGAVNVTGTDANNKEDHRFKPAADIRKIYEAKGITADKTIYEYCHSGDRSAHAYVILKHLLGYKNVHFNDGGWMEWSTILSLPAENQAWLWEQQKGKTK